MLARAALAPLIVAFKASVGLPVEERSAERFDALLDAAYGAVEDGCREPGEADVSRARGSGGAFGSVVHQVGGVFGAGGIHGGGGACGPGWCG